MDNDLRMTLPARLERNQEEKYGGIVLMHFGLLHDVGVLGMDGLGGLIFDTLGL